MKCWKKVRSNQYESVFLNNKKRQKVYTTIDYGKFRVDLEDIGDTRKIIKKNFKDKPSAIKFANKYMKQHNSC